LTDYNAAGPSAIPKTKMGRCPSVFAGSLQASLPPFTTVQQKHGDFIRAMHLVLLLSPFIGTEDEALRRLLWRPRLGPYQKISSRAMVRITTPLSTK
jgi:hypothetical protein